MWQPWEPLDAYYMCERDKEWSVVSKRDLQFEEFFDARVALLRRVSFAIVGDWQLAEDVVQTAFVKLYLAWPRIRPESLEAYARRAVVNTSISQVRRPRRELPFEQLPEQGALDPDPSIGLLDALQGLPPAQRAVIALRFLDDLSVTDVAEALQISEGAVKSQTARGLTKLRQHLPQQERILR